jgi:uncharacterized protein involved in outer membrane biogenesis
VVAIFIVAIFTVDLGRFKPQVESLVSDQLGRDLKIVGTLHVSVGEDIQVIAEDIRLDNPDRASSLRLPSCVYSTSTKFGKIVSGA